MKYLSIDVGGTYTKFAVITDSCEILEKHKKATVIEPLEAFIDSLVEIYQVYQGKVDGIALSIAGIIDSEKGFMHTGGNITCIKELSIVEVLEKRCRIPVTVENDAKCAALAEVWKGALEDCKDGIVMVVGTGIGGAVIHNREILKGIHNMTGEFSYVITDSEPEFTLNQTFAGNSGIHSLIKIVSKYTGVPAEELNGEKVFALANAGNEKAILGIREYARRLAIQINNYQFILDSERVVIGGGISVQPMLIQIIREELAKINQVYPWKLPIAEVGVCKFFNDANLIGAVYVHMKYQETIKPQFV